MRPGSRHDALVVYLPVDLHSHHEVTSGATTPNHRVASLEEPAMRSFVSLAPIASASAAPTLGRNSLLSRTGEARAGWMLCGPRPYRPS